MEVMNPVSFQQLQQKINGLSKEYFSYSTSIQDRDFAVYKPLHIEQEKTTRLTRPRENQSRSLIVWGCGEFGQHGLDQSADVTFEMAICECMTGECMLPDGELPVTTVCGSSHTLVLTGTNHVYSWGNGTSGQLGNGTCVTTIKPTLVPMTLDGKVQGMSCGARHSFIWTVNGYCYSFGNNFNAQLGYNFSKADFKENQLKPVLMELFPDMKVKEVACGARHSLFLLTTGRVMAVGSNQHGQIGSDTTEDVVIPTMLHDLNSITHVTCGNIHSLASHENGSVYAWGYGKAFGNKTRHVATPQKFTPKDIGSNTVISLAGGDCHSMVLYDDGRLFTWGNNYEGQLGVGKDMKYQNEPQAIPCHLLPRPVKQIACGETTSAAVTGTGELFLWGKNAGLIHSDKPSQYFQYIPHHIQMDGLFVMQVSCGAWHVSVIVKHCEDNGEETPQEIESELCDAEQPASLNTTTMLGCENRENIDVSDDTTEQHKNESCYVESVDVGGSTPIPSFMTTSSSSQVEVSRANSDDDNDAVDTCFITKCSSNSEFSRMEDEGSGDGLLVTDKELWQYSQDEIVAKHQDDSSHLVAQHELPDNSSSYNIESYNMDRTACETNNTGQTNVMDPSNDLKEECHLLSMQNRFQQGKGHAAIENDSSRITKTSVHSYLDKNPTTMYSQKPSSSRCTSELENKDKQNSNKSILSQSESARTCNAPEDVCSIKLTTQDNISLEKEEREDNRLLNKDLSSDMVKDKKFTADSNANSKNHSFTKVEENNRLAIKKDSFVKNDRSKEVHIFKNNRGMAIERDHLKRWNEPEVQLRTVCSTTEKNISKDSIKESLVLRRNIRLAATPLQNHASIKSTLTQNVETKLATKAVHNKTIEQESKLTVTPNHTIDCNTQVLTRQQTVPVIDLGFERVIRQAEQRGIKPSFTTFRNVWKASNLIREKQRQKKIGGKSKGRGSDGMFSLESMLPNRPAHAVREIEKWSKINEDVICLHNDSAEERRTQSDELKCHHHKGLVLPPICSCRKNGVPRKCDTLSTNIFIDRK